MSANAQKLLIVFLISIIFLNFSNIIYQNRSRFFTNDYWLRYKSLEKLYKSSQYVNKNPVGWITDEAVNAYAGGAYIKGISPVLIAPDTPPLGRYMIGLSALILGNENSIILISGISSLILLYLLGLQVFKSKITALLAPLLFSFEPIFKNQFVYTPLLDIIQLVFMLLSFYFFNKSFSKKHTLLYLLISSISLGIFISTKFFITGLTIVAAYFVVLIFNRVKDKIVKLTVSLFASVLILLLSYVRVFWYGYGFRNFLGIQKWVFLYHKSQLIFPFTIWPLILINRWYTWWDNNKISYDPQWQITWPIITLLSLTVILFYFFKKLPKNKNIETLIFWAVAYFLFFSFGQITARYFVILIPILYMISLYGLENITVIKLKKTK